MTTIPPPAPGIVPRPPPPQSQAARMDDMVVRYRALREKKSDIAERHQKELQPYNEALQQLGAMILDALNKAGVDSVKTKAGTAFTSVRRGYTVKDPAVFRQWLEENDRFDLLETRVSKESIEALIANGEQLPPGIGVSSDTTLNVRK